jgi:hypothetical protein
MLKSLTPALGILLFSYFLTVNQISIRKQHMLQGYSDSNWGGSAIDRKSTLGCYFILGSKFITWFNRKQTSVALSSTEVEHMKESIDSCEAIWICKLLTRLFDQEFKPTMIYYDKQSCIKLSKNLVFHDRFKHIEIKCHSIQYRI